MMQLDFDWTQRYICSCNCMLGYEICFDNMGSVNLVGSTPLTMMHQLETGIVIATLTSRVLMPRED